MNILPANMTRKQLAAIEDGSSSFFAIAQEDLEASKILFEKQMYRPAVLLLQQAIEKAVKSLALQTGLIDFEGLRQLGHKPQSLYTDLIIQMSNSLTNSLKDAKKQEDLEAILTAIGDDVQNLVDTFMEIKNFALRTAAAYNKCELTEEELFTLLDIIDSMNRDFFELDEIIQQNLGEKEFNQLLIKGNLASKIGIFLLPFNPAEKKKMNEMIDKILEILPSIAEFFESFFMFIISEISAAMSLFYLSLLTAPHAIVSRYPYATGENIDPLGFYTDETPIIMNLEEIYLYADYTFDQLERFFSILTYLPDIQREAFRKKRAAPRLTKQNRALKGGNEP